MIPNALKEEQHVAVIVRVRRPSLWLPARAAWCNAVRRWQGRLACRASNCWRRARFSRMRSSRELNALTRHPRRWRSEMSMADTECRTSISCVRLFCLRKTPTSNTPTSGNQRGHGNRDQRLRTAVRRLSSARFSHHSAAVASDLFLFSCRDNLSLICGDAKELEAVDS